MNGFLELNFDVLQAASDNSYVDISDIRLVNLGPIALFSNFKLTTSSGKHLEKVSHTQIVSLMYELLTSSKDSDDLSIGFDRSRDRKKANYLIIKVVKAKIFLELI